MFAATLATVTAFAVVLFRKNNKTFWVVVEISWLEGLFHAVCCVARK